MRKIIHVVDRRAQLVCDAPGCGFQLGEGEVEFGAHLIGMPCPACGANLLTERDYRDSERMQRRINWINKWFGWLGKEVPDASYKRVSFRNHNGEVIIRHED